MLTLLFCPTSFILRPPSLVAAHARHHPAAMCVQPEPAAVADLKLKEIKVELDELGVTWRGVCFEREDLVQALLDARARGPAEPSAAARPAAVAEPAAETPASSAATPEADGAAFEEAYRPAYEAAMQLKTKELRAELAARSIGWADALEKSELAARLAEAKARAALFSASGALTPGGVGVVDEEQCEQELADARTPLLLDVFAEWCGPCKMIAPWLKEVAGKLGERARVAKLDSDDAPELSTELKVSGLPTVIFMRDGNEMYRLEGVPATQAEFEKLVEKHLLDGASL